MWEFGRSQPGKAISGAVGNFFLTGPDTSVIAMPSGSEKAMTSRLKPSYLSLPRILEAILIGHTILTLVLGFLNIFIVQLIIKILYKSSVFIIFILGSLLG